MDVGCGECTMTDSVLKNIYVHKIDFGVEKNAKADTDTDADMSKDKKSGDDLSNCNSNKNTNEECISILGRDDFSRRGTKSSNDVSEKMINNFNVQNDKIKNTDNIFDVSSMNSTQDFSMQIPKLKVFIGLEINIDPLKIAKKNILQFLLESDPQNVPGIKCSLEKVFLYHGSVLSENVMRDMSIDEEERERDEKGRKKERGENDEAGPDINHFNDLDTANKSKSNKFIAITCIEVIEHLPSIKDAESALIKVLCEFKPDFAIFSTPNYEANRAIRAAVTGCTYTSKKTSSIERREEFGRQLGGRKGKGQDEERTGEGRGEGVTRVDDKQVKEIEKEEEEEEEFREADHKFEFTRKEFREWAAIGLNSCKGDYEVHFTEVGTLLPGMRCVDENENNELTENIKIAQNVGIRMYEKEYFEAISPFSKKFLETSGSSSSGGNISLIDKSIENNSNKAFDNPLLNSNQNGDGRSFINTSSFLERGKERGCGGASQFAIFRRIGGKFLQIDLLFIFILFIFCRIHLSPY